VAAIVATLPSSYTCSAAETLPPSAGEELSATVNCWGELLELDLQAVITTTHVMKTKYRSSFFMRGMA
jgi:hypothetical protein